MNKEAVLREYISQNYEKYPLDLLKQEAVKKGYGSELFENLLKEIRNKKPKEDIFKKEEKELVLVPIEKDKLASVLKNKDNSVKSFFTPTQITTYSFCVIILLVFGLGLANSFSLKSFSFQEENQEFIGKSSFFEVGYPTTFISVSMSEEEPFVFNFVGLMIDFFIYFLVAYALDLTITNSFKAFKKEVKDEEKEKIIKD